MASGRGISKLWSAKLSLAFKYGTKAWLALERASGHEFGVKWIYSDFSIAVLERARLQASA